MRINCESFKGNYIDIVIKDVNTTGLCSLVDCKISTDSEPNDILTPCRYKSGTISILTDDNSLYAVNWFGKQISIYRNDNLYISGYISAQLTNAPFDCMREVIELQFVDTLTWIKSQPYDGILYTTIRDVLMYFKTKTGVEVVDFERVYNVNELSPLDMYINIGSLTDNIENITCGEVIEAICKLLCVTAYVDGEYLHLDYVCSKATNVVLETLNEDGESTITNYKRRNYVVQPYESGTNVSYIDPKKSVKIECKYKEYSLPEDNITYQATEYDKFSYYFQYSGTKKDYKNVALLQAFGTNNNTEYYRYAVADAGNYNSSATTPEVSYMTKITEDNISTYITHDKMMPNYVSQACGYSAGAIHTKTCSQQLESINDEPAGDESFSEGLLLYGVRGMTNRSQLTPTLLYPMYKKTIDINAVFSHDKALIYSVTMQWNKYREEFFEVDYTGTSISGINFIYPRLAFRILTEDGYLPVQSTGDAVSNYRYANSGITLNNTWSIIKPKQPSYPDSWGNDMSLSFDDFWSVSESYGNSIILPSNQYIRSIEIVLLWAEQPRFMAGSTTLESYIASNLFVTESWKLESKGININDTDTVYIWENDGVNIDGDVQSYDAEFPSYDNKGDVTNALCINHNNETILVNNICTSEFSGNLHPEEIRLNHYQRQYTTPSFSECVILQDTPFEAGIYTEPITNKIMRVIGYNYDVIKDKTTTNLIEIK